MARKRNRGKWIKLYYELFDRDKFLEYREELRAGKRTKAQRRTADNEAIANVIRLYLALGLTDEGEINYTKVGARVNLERWMDLEGDALTDMLDSFAEHGIIDREHWTILNTVTTANAIEQAVMRGKFKDRSDNANSAKSGKEP